MGVDAEEELNTNVEERESRRSGWLLAKTVRRSGLFIYSGLVGRI